jgi:prepilin-type processing-associated H-X9-DG protein
LKQIVLADLLYAQDNNDYIVPYYTDIGKVWWNWGLDPYLGRHDTTFYGVYMHCPSSYEAHPAIAWYRSIYAITWGYTFPGSALPHGWRMHGDGPGTSARLSEITRPAEVASFMDHGSNPVNYLVYCPVCSAFSNGDNFTQRHSGGGNAAYFDGHTGWLAFSAIMTNANDVFGHTSH